MNKTALSTLVIVNLLLTVFFIIFSIWTYVRFIDHSHPHNHAVKSSSRQKHQGYQFDIRGRDKRGNSLGFKFFEETN